MEQKIKRIVEELLKEDSRCRGKGKATTWLIFRVLKRLGVKFWIDYKDLDKIPAFETITKAKRKIQNEENKYNEEEFIPEPGVTFEKPVRSLG